MAEERTDVPLAHNADKGGYLRLVSVTLNHGHEGGPSVSLLVLAASDESAVTIQAVEAELASTEELAMSALRPFLNNSTHVQIDAYGAGIRPLGPPHNGRYGTPDG